MFYLRELSPKILLPLAVCLVVVLTFNYFMWQNYRQIRQKVAEFGDDNYFASDAGREQVGTRPEMRGGGVPAEEISSGVPGVQNHRKGDYRLAMIISGSRDKKELMRSGAERAAHHLGVEIKFYHSGPAGQMTAADYLELAGLADFDGVMLEGSAEELAERIDRLSHELPVVTMNIDFPDSSRLSYVGLDQHQAGFQIGRYLLENIQNRQGKIVLLSRAVAGEYALSSSEQLQVFGFQEALAAAGHSDMLKRREVRPDLLEVSSELNEILSEHEVAAIFTPSEELTLTLSESAVLSPAADDIFMVGYGSRAGLAGQLEELEFDALVYRDSEQIGYQAVKEMVAILERGYVNLHSQVKMELLDSGELGKLEVGVDLDEGEIE